VILSEFTAVTFSQNDVVKKTWLRDLLTLGEKTRKSIIDRYFTSEIKNKPLGMKHIYPWVVVNHCSVVFLPVIG
jgi:hypothetical protein